MPAEVRELLSLRIGLILLLLGCSAYFSGSESALFSLRSLQLRRLAERPTRATRAILALLGRPRRLLATILIGNTSVNTLLSVIAAGVFAGAFGAEGSPVLATLVIGLVLLVFGEVVPKSIAVGVPLGTARLVAPTLIFVQELLRPLSAFAERLSDVLAGGLERRIPRRDEALSEKEIKMLVTMGWEQGVVGLREKDILHNAFHLNDRQVGEIVTPRTRVFALDVDARVADVRAAIARAGYSRVPLYRGSPENLVGYVEVSDLLWGGSEPDPRRLRDVMRELPFYPETKRVGQLLLEMARRREEIAGVVDEHGGFDGIVTVEDAVEEVLGEIVDLHDQERYRVAEAGNGELGVGATMELDVFNELLSADLRDPEVETIGGFVINRLGHIPSPGEWVEAGGFRLTVDQAAPNRVLRLRVRRAGRGRH